jgi:pimeloyl-ACP methyl ester carboxylesterase
MRKIVSTIVAALACIGLFAATDAAQSQKLAEYGIVLMHGKSGQPGGTLKGLADDLRAAGANVVMPEMAWSRGRMYDATYDQVMQQVSSEVAKLRAAGKKKIVVAGHSFGANAAMGYGARHDDIAGIIALAPGHTPDSNFFREKLGVSVQKARDLVAGGKGDTKETFSDVNQRGISTVRATAKVYLSLFDPTGPASMSGNAASMKAVPLLMVVGKGDQVINRAKRLYFDPAAKNPKSKYVEVSGGHMDTPGIARTEVNTWLSGL